MPRDGARTPTGNNKADQKQIAPDHVDLLSFTDLCVRSVSLKLRIEEAKRRYDLPLDPALGAPSADQRAAGDGLDISERHND